MSRTKNAKLAKERERKTRSALLALFAFFVRATLLCPGCGSSSARRPRSRGSPPNAGRSSASRGRFGDGCGKVPVDGCPEDVTEVQARTEARRWVGQGCAEAHAEVEGRSEV